LLPRFGILGYGWAEVMACGSYFAIHAGLKRSVAISYRQLALSLAVFMPCLFVIPVSGLVLRMIR
jgi:hypothetical protein